MKVFLPSPLHLYTKGVSPLEAEGATVDAVLKDLDRRHPGIRFRMVNEQDALREHIRVFVGGEELRDLGRRLKPGDEVHVLQALSGG